MQQKGGKMKFRNLLLTAFVFSGMAALIYELTWIRPLQFLLGSTIYTISIIFAVFMGGLGLGSWVISRYTDKIKNLPLAYALIELGIGLYGVLLLSIFNLLPKVYNAIYGLHTNFYVFEFVQFVLIFIVLLIPTTLMGATFPIIAKFYTEKKIGKGIGEVYSANNLGAIAGSFLAGFVLIPLLGIKFSIIFAGALNILIATIIILRVDKKAFKSLVPLAIILFLLLASFGNYNIQQMHSGGFYRTHAGVEDMGDVVYYEEGVYATVTVRFLRGELGRVLFINGKSQGSTSILDLRVNFLLSYLPVLIAPESENALVIGLGAGITSGQLSQVVDATTIEIESAVVDATRYFNMFNMDVLENPKHKLIIDDGRNYLLKNYKKYDLIVQEPSDPWQSFSTALYSEEFFELVKEDLTEDGLFVKWVPIYTMSVDDFRNFYKTFNSVFPNIAAFANIKADEDTPVRFGTSEILLIGSKSEIEIDANKINFNYNSLPEQSKEYLNSLYLGSGEDIFHLLLFTNEQIKGYAEDAKLITDDRPILEFSTGKKVLSQDPQEVIRDINNFLGRNG